MPNLLRTAYYAGQEVLVEDLGHDQSGRRQADQKLSNDFWHDGILADPNGLSNLDVSVDGTTGTLFNVGWGTAYGNGYRIAIDSNTTYNASAPSQTTDGVCTPQSSGNRGVSLADYTLNKENYVWLEYLEASRTTPRSISTIDGNKHFPHRDDGYRVIISTVNPPGNRDGITNSVFLATVFGQGAGNPLLAAPNGICQIKREWAIPKMFSTTPGTCTFIEGHHITNRTITGEKLAAGTITRDKIAGGTITREEVASQALVPAGVCLPFAGANTPSGWLLCDGSAVSRTTYSALFDVVSTAFGTGDGSTTFNLPDLRGRTVFGKDDMGGSAASRLTGSPTGGITGSGLGNSGGEQGHTLTTAETPAHTHSLQGSGINTGTTYMERRTAQLTADTATGSTGGGGSHNTVPPGIVLNYIIKT